MRGHGSHPGSLPILRDVRAADTSSEGLPEPARIRFLRDAASRSFGPPDGVMAINRLGLEVSVTTIDRTIADLFDRHDLAGDAQELFNSLDLVARADTAALVRYMRAASKATAAGALGHRLGREQTRLGTQDAALEDLRALKPAQPRYALRAKGPFHAESSASFTQASESGYKAVGVNKTTIHWKLTGPKTS